MPVALQPQPAVCARGGKLTAEHSTALGPFNPLCSPAALDLTPGRATLPLDSAPATTYFPAPVDVRYAG